MDDLYAARFEVRRAKPANSGTHATAETIATASSTRVDSQLCLPTMACT